MNFALVFWPWLVICLTLFVVGACRGDVPVVLVGCAIMFMLVAFMTGAEIATPHQTIGIF